jgi:hypothetical protein
MSCIGLFLRLLGVCAKSPSKNLNCRDAETIRDNRENLKLRRYCIFVLFESSC